MVRTIGKGRIFTLPGNLSDGLFMTFILPSIIQQPHDAASSSIHIRRTPAAQFLHEAGQFMHVHPFAVASLPPINHYQPENGPLLVGPHGGAGVTGPARIIRDPMSKVSRAPMTP